MKAGKGDRVETARQPGVLPQSVAGPWHPGKFDVGVIDGCILTSEDESG